MREEIKTIGENIKKFAYYEGKLVIGNYPKTTIELNNGFAIGFGVSVKINDLRINLTDEEAGYLTVIYEKRMEEIGESFLMRASKFLKGLDNNNAITK